MHLAEVMPVFQFVERHATHVHASPETIYAAIRAVRAGEILFFRTLVAIRRGFLPLRESILNPGNDEPLLDVATRSGFELRADDPPSEIVISSCIARNVTAAMNFMVTPNERGGCEVSTETRVHAADRRAEWRFRLYWLAIRPGSGLIRRMWLRAIRRRAEA
jgi:hypothetical protein